MRPCKRVKEFQLARPRKGEETPVTRSHVAETTRRSDRDIDFPAARTRWSKDEFVRPRLAPRCPDADHTLPVVFLDALTPTRTL